MMRLAALLTLAVTMLPVRVYACSTCFGAAGDPQTEGRNAAILTLLITTYTLLTGMAAAVFFLWRRAQKLGASEMASEPAETNRG